MRRLFGCLSLGALFLLLTAGSVAAQATAQLSGTVRDESGAVLPGVTVTVTQTDTGAARTVVTDGSGSYVIPNLPTGPYRLEVSLAGFRTYAQTGIVLQVAATPVINTVLAVGSVEETVAVEAAAPLVDVRSAGISAVVENERIMELPLQGRQVTDLLVLAGAAVQTGIPQRGVPGGVSISVAGGLPFGVAYSLDGATHNNPQTNANLPLPFPDALQEFRVATSGLSAENGMHSGASVNAVTKSGTNRFAGSAFEFLRDRRFNAKSPFARLGPDGEREDDGLRRSQFGGTLGGPIIRDRLFFFGAYQGTIKRQVPASNIAFVPTPAMLAGDFTTFASAACNGGRQVTLGAPFVGNRIDPARFSPALVNLTKQLPATTDPCGQVTYRTNDDLDEHQPLARVDYQWSGSQSMFGRYLASRTTIPPGDPDASLLERVGAGSNNLLHSVTLGDTMVLSPSVVNSVRFVHNYTTVSRATTPFFGPSDLGAKVFSYPPGRIMSLDVTGGFSIGGTKRDELNTVYGLSDDLTLVKGRHQLAFGGQVQYLGGRLHLVVSHRRYLDHRRPCDGAGPRGLLGGTRHHPRARRPQRPAHRQLVSGAVWPGRVAGVQPFDGQRRRAVGAVLRPERPEQRRLDLRDGELPARRQEHGIPQRAGGAHLSGRSGIPVGTNRVEQAVDEFRPACGPGVGRPR